MAFLFSGPESGHTERRAATMRRSRPFSFIRTLTVGFGITPNLLTLLREAEEGARGLGLVTLTAGGDFHPALRTSAARNERPEGTMPARRRASKRHCDGNVHVGHDAAAAGGSEDRRSSL